MTITFKSQDGSAQILNLNSPIESIILNYEHMKVTFTYEVDIYQYTKRMCWTLKEESQ